MISGTAKAGRRCRRRTARGRTTRPRTSTSGAAATRPATTATASGPTRATYALDNGDVGSTIRVTVRAGNAFGSNPATSAQTAVVAAAGPAPANTALPVIGGVPRDGQILVTNTGNWANSPNHYDYQWLRCDAAGNNCGNFGANSSSAAARAVRGRSHDSRRRLGRGTSTGTTRARLGPDRRRRRVRPGRRRSRSTRSRSRTSSCLSAVQFIPSRLNSRAAFIGRFRVTDTRGNLVSGALVYAIGLPYGWVRAAPEVVTGSDGWATIQFVPTAPDAGAPCRTRLLRPRSQAGRKAADRRVDSPARPDLDRLAGAAILRGARG